jgi:hypothetical protein
LFLFYVKKKITFLITFDIKTTLGDFWCDANEWGHFDKDKWVSDYFSYTMPNKEIGENIRYEVEDNR